ncbi:isochorismatase-like protein [Leishmania panamensis]|uniref:Isochorismatase-like protein n=2 Tax=Leishmania guyanensis species complex TaxID=38579 RepID=A0A088RJ62_LEIPA|nr:isochorismatase-like protein [Leishmania panamensis]AIN95840.1 isochorismatase-like protein [Leishmania panamensis]
MNEAEDASSLCTSLPPAIVRPNTDVTVPQRGVHSAQLLRKFTECRTLFLCCDMQEKLADKIPGFHETIRVSNNITLFCEMLGPTYCNVIATVQYPKGVGPLYHEIQLPPNTPVFPKMKPSMLVPEALPYLYGDAERGILPVQQAVLWGHETHVCIMQTADELLRRGFRVAITTDGCAAQRRIDHEVALMEMSKWSGLLLTSSIGMYAMIVRADEIFRKPVMKLSLDGGHVFKRPYRRSEDPTRLPQEREREL